MTHLPKQLVTVTPLSKLLAMILFIAMPFIGFYVGTKYQARIDVGKISAPVIINRPEVIDDIFPSKEITQPASGVACTMDAKICPDGSAVGRIAPNCEFAKCP